MSRASEFKPWGADRLFLEFTDFSYYPTRGERAKGSRKDARTSAVDRRTRPTPLKMPKLARCILILAALRATDAKKKKKRKPKPADPAPAQDARDAQLRDGCAACESLATDAAALVRQAVKKRQAGADAAYHVKGRALRRDEASRRRDAFFAAENRRDLRRLRTQPDENAPRGGVHRQAQALVRGLGAAVAGPRPEAIARRTRGDGVAATPRPGELVEAGRVAPWIVRGVARRRRGRELDLPWSRPPRPRAG